MATGRDVRFNDIHIKSTGAIYLGDKTNNIYDNGTWKIIRSGNDLVIYRKETGTFTEKGRFEA